MEDLCDLSEVWQDWEGEATAPPEPNPTPEEHYESNFRRGLTARHGRLRPGGVEKSNTDFELLLECIDDLRMKQNVLLALVFTMFFVNLCSMARSLSKR